jgi:CheY-like chemotaxis protein
MSKRILAVDDSKTMRDMVAFTLCNAGFQVEEAEDGKAALGKLGGAKFDLIITDLNMPNMDGISLIRNVRAGSLDALEAHGIGITLDRFGGSQSSLDDIRELSCRRIKIDKSLVAAITTSARDARIVASLVALAQATGLAVTAEGVETAEQAEVLRGLGCPEMQGFLFSRPRTATEVLTDMRGQNLFRSD